MTSFDLRRLHLRPGEEQRQSIELELESLSYGGQRYEPAPASVPAELAIARTTGGWTFSLGLEPRFVGPCYRCLDPAEVGPPIAVTEYQADDPGDDDELRTPYLVDGSLDLSAWARDSIALALPEQILCRPDCAGLCPVCGKNLNDEPHEHAEEATDTRWTPLAELREKLERET
jgi:DUF177 domain-containing protein